jgi:hypothetical protein
VPAGYEANTVLGGDGARAEETGDLAGVFGSIRMLFIIGGHMSVVHCDSWIGYAEEEDGLLLLRTDEWSGP